MGDVVALTRWQECQWDSSFFGRRIARIDTSSTSPEQIAAIAASADAQRIDCLYLLVDASDSARIANAERSGFSLVDIRTTLEQRLTALSPREADSPAPTIAKQHVIRSGRPSDLPALTAIARESHRQTRFHRDRHFDRQRAGEMYAIWIEKALHGERSDVVYVAEDRGQVLGYVAASRSGDASIVGLIAVADAARGRGYGGDLLRAVGRWTAQEGRDRVVAVTQGHNAASLRFYERAGFVAAAVELWYHRWRPAAH
jgi:dTDP-4-amino-4,6-dideoxy-D-galactose acyltransferase